MFFIFKFYVNILLTSYSQDCQIFVPIFFSYKLLSKQKIIHEPANNTQLAKHEFSRDRSTICYDFKIMICKFMRYLHFVENVYTLIYNFLAYIISQEHVKELTADKQYQEKDVILVR